MPMKDGGPLSWSWTSKKQANTLSMTKAGILGRDSCACEERSVKWIGKRPHPTRCVEDWRSQESSWRGPQLKEITYAKTTALCTLLVNGWWRVWWHVVVFALWGFQSSFTLSVGWVSDGWGHENSTNEFDWIDLVKIRAGLIAPSRMGECELTAMGFDEVPTFFLMDSTFRGASVLAERLDFHH